MKPIIALLFTTFLFSVNCTAQQGIQSTFDLKEFNRPVKINCIFQSAGGYIYLGTHSGLYRFDGENFNKIYEMSEEILAMISALIKKLDNE